jgi:hypothetical protein
MFRAVAVLLLACGVIGCSGKSSRAGRDSGVEADAPIVFIDASSPVVDARVPDDASVLDASSRDASFGIDAPRADASRMADAKPVDAFIGDSATPDSAVIDAPFCNAPMHVCICATGHYCAGLGIPCMSPVAPCP